MSSATAALGVAITFVWFGMVAAISFLEAPLKFGAPGVTIPIGLAIGRRVFGALNAVEVVLGLLLVVALVASDYRVIVVVAAVIALATLAVQLIVVRPALRRRTAAVLSGGAGEKRSHQHLAYVALELIKVMALLIAGVAALAG